MSPGKTCSGSVCASLLKGVGRASGTPASLRELGSPHAQRVQALSFPLHPQTVSPLLQIQEAAVLSDGVAAKVATWCN